MGNLKNFKAIDNEFALQEFNNIVEILKLRKDKLTYLSLGIKEYETNNGATIIPNSEWKVIVEKQKMYHLDPIFVAATITKKNYVLFSRFNYNTEIEKQILQERRNLEMNKGFIKIMHYKTFRIAFTYATGLSTFNENDYIIKNGDKIKKFEDYSKDVIGKFLIR